MRTFDEYQLAVDRTVVQPALDAKSTVLGLCSEAGEVADLFIKRDKDGVFLNRQDLIHELGDILWYVTRLATIFDVSIETIARDNVTKLLRRYNLEDIDSGRPWSGNGSGFVDSKSERTRSLYDRVTSDGGSELD